MRAAAARGGLLRLPEPGTALNHLLLAVTGVVMLYPMWYVFMYGLSDPQAVLGKGAILWPQEPTLAAVWFVLRTPEIMRSYLNTAFVVIAGTLLSIAVTSLYAYPLSTRIPGVRVISLLTYFTILFSGGIIPTYVIVRETGLINSLWSLIVPQLVWPFYVFIMIKFFRNIPDSLPESARMDGANDLVILIRIVLPLSLPALASVGLFYAVRYWNEFFTAIIYLPNKEKWTLQVILRSLLITQLEDQFDMPSGDQTAGSVTADTVKMATVMVGTLPVMLIYPFLQKHFAKGVMIGAVKG